MSEKKYLDQTGLAYFASKIKTALAGKASSTHSHDAATTSAAGFMSTSDKSKLDGIATGATKITVDTALSSTSTNPVQNKVINTALAGKAASSHGNHVPTTQTADNATFLRNDNTWQKVTPANIGAAASSHNHSAANITSGTLSSDRLPTVPVTKGGTGATTASAALYNLINGASEVTEPATGDYLGVHDASGATGKKISIENLFNNLGTMGLATSVIKQGITSATEMAGTVANDADLMLVADASASNGVRNIKLSSLVTYFKNNGLAGESHTHSNYATKAELEAAIGDAIAASY